VYGKLEIWEWTVYSKLYVREWTGSRQPSRREPSYMYGSGQAAAKLCTGVDRQQPSSVREWTGSRQALYGSGQAAQALYGSGQAAAKLCTGVDKQRKLCTGVDRQPPRQPRATLCTAVHTRFLISPHLTIPTHFHAPPDRSSSQVHIHININWRMKANATAFLEKLVDTGRGKRRD
jgi:hypothetical protein